MLKYIVLLEKKKKTLSLNLEGYTVKKNYKLNFINRKLSINDKLITQKKFIKYF